MKRPNRTRRGVSLVVVMLILVPVMTTGFCMALNHVDINVRESRRESTRLRAKLLAESALETFRATGEIAPGAPPVGPGTFRIERLESNRFEAIGAVEWEGSRNRNITQARIRFERHNDAIRLLGPVRYTVRPAAISVENISTHQPVP